MYLAVINMKIIEIIDIEKLGIISLNKFLNNQNEYLDIIKIKIYIIEIAYFYHEIHYLFFQFLMLIKRSA